MDIAALTARQLLDQVRRGVVSAADVMDATYDRIALWNPHVNAITSLLERERAMALARAVDASGAKGPLSGLPIAVKDLANAAGFRTTMGSPLFAQAQPAARDDIIVARMRAAGAIVIGKTNTPEFGLGSHTVNPVFGLTRNPWALDRSAGGSSGGAAAALATGMLALADGSDMMGSLRNPAGWNGVYGLRPTWGAAPAEPHGDSFLHQLSTNGPMARNPDDLGLLLSVQAGPDPRQPHGVAPPPAPPPRRWRIGWLGDWGGAYPMARGVLDCCEEALSLFTELGHDVTPCPPPFPAEALWSAWTVLRSWQVAASLVPVAALPGAEEQLNAPALWELRRGTALSALDVHRASVTRSQWFATAAALFERFDVLALPTAQCWPFDVALERPTEIAGVAMDTYHRWMEVVVPASLIGLPALAVPAGFSALGAGGEASPMGLQLIGPRGADYGLLALAETYHARAPWTARRPTTPGR